MPASPLLGVRGNLVVLWLSSPTGGDTEETWSPDASAAPSSPGAGSLAQSAVRGVGLRPVKGHPGGLWTTMTAPRLENNCNTLAPPPPQLAGHSEAPQGWEEGARRREPPLPPSPHSSNLARTSESLTKRIQNKNRLYGLILQEKRYGGDQAIPQLCCSITS